MTKEYANDLVEQNGKSRNRPSTCGNLAYINNTIASHWSKDRPFNNCTEQLTG